MVSKHHKNPRAHKNKIGTPPPKKTQNTPPPQNEEIYGHGGFSCRKNTEILGAHKIGAAISGPRIADKNFTDTKIFLILPLGTKCDLSCLRQRFGGKLLRFGAPRFQITSDLRFVIGIQKVSERSRNSLRSLKIDCFETPETVSRLFRTLFGAPGRKPGDSLETFSGFRARIRSRRTRPGKPNQRHGQNEKLMNFAHFFVNSGVFSLGKQGTKLTHLELLFQNAPAKSS